MAFNNTTGVWTTDDATDLKTSAAFGAVDDISQSNGTFLVGTTLDSDYTGRTVLARIDSGSITFANDETIVGSLNGGTTQRVGFWVNGGELVINGGVDEANATTPFVINSHTTQPGNGPFQADRAGIALTSGNLTLGSIANPVVKIISTKGITASPGGNDMIATGRNLGPCSWNIQTLIFENPRFNVDIADAARWPTLGFRNSSANYTAGASSFNTLIGKGIRILDVSGADAANAGMLPVNVEGSVIIVGDNGTGSRQNNLIGVPFIGSATSEIDWSFETNTAATTGSTGLANSNWFIIGDYDTIPGVRRRIANQKGGAVFNKQITFNGVNGSTTQRFWLPERENNNRLTTATATNITAHNSLAGASELVPHGITPITGAGATNGYQIGGATGAYDLTNLPLHNSADPATDFYRIRTGIVWNQGTGATGVNSTVVRQHDDNEYLYAGSFLNKLSAQTINYESTQGVVFDVQDADDTLITNIATANRNILPNFTVTLPTLAGSGQLPEADKDVTIRYTGSSDLEIQPHNLFTLVKNQMMTRLATNINTTVANTANDYVVDYLDALVNGGATWTITSATHQLNIANMDTDGLYNTADFDLNVTHGNVAIITPSAIRTIQVPATNRTGFFGVRNVTTNTTLVDAVAVSTTFSYPINSSSFDTSHTLRFYWKPASSDTAAYNTTIFDYTGTVTAGTTDLAENRVAAVLWEDVVNNADVINTGGAVSIIADGDDDFGTIDRMEIRYSDSAGNLDNSTFGASRTLRRTILATDGVQYLSRLIAHELSADVVRPGAGEVLINTDYAYIDSGDNNTQVVTAVTRSSDSTTDVNSDLIPKTFGLTGGGTTPTVTVIPNPAGATPGQIAAAVASGLGTGVSAAVDASDTNRRIRWMNGDGTRVAHFKPNANGNLEDFS